MPSSHPDSSVSARLRYGERSIPRLRLQKQAYGQLLSQWMRGRVVARPRKDRLGTHSCSLRSELLKRLQNSCRQRKPTGLVHVPSRRPLFYDPFSNAADLTILNKNVHGCSGVLLAHRQAVARYSTRPIDFGQKSKQGDRLVCRCTSGFGGLDGIGFDDNTRGKGSLQSRALTAENNIDSGFTLPLFFWNPRIPSFEHCG